jgi:hypothetical protein
VDVLGVAPVDELAERAPRAHLALLGVLEKTELCRRRRRRRVQRAAAAAAATTAVRIPRTKESQLPSEKKSATSCERTYHWVFVFANWA